MTNCSNDGMSESKGVGQVRLLTELYWSLPLPLSSAEARLRNEQLPALEDEASHVTGLVSVLVSI